MILEVHNVLLAVVTLGLLCYVLGMFTCWALMTRQPRIVINPQAPELRCIKSWAFRDGRLHVTNPPREAPPSIKSGIGPADIPPPGGSGVKHG